MKKPLKYAFGIVMLVVFLLVAVNEGRSQDQDSRWVYRTIKQRYVAYDHWTGQYVYRWRYVQVRNHTYHLPEVRVYGYTRRGDDDRKDRVDESQCRSERVDVLSTEHQSEDAAREAARKLWMAKVQWTAGGQFMNLDEASEVRWRCGPSNAHDTVSGRLAEAAGTLTGKGGQNVRCALWARPCKGPRESDRGRR
jgi:hypothetical protein